MTGFSNPIIGGGGALVYPAIHSPNFDQATQTGWSIDKNGDAFFFNITSSGSLIVSASGGLFVYNGLPAFGNPPICAITEATEDPFGNPASALANFGPLAGAHFGIDNSGNLYLANSSGLTTIFLSPDNELIAFGSDVVPGGLVSMTLAQIAGTVFGGAAYPAGIALSGLPMLIYSGTPAAGNLVASSAPASGTDTFGNDIIGSGFTVYGSGGQAIQMTDAGGDAEQIFFTGAAIEGLAAAINCQALLSSALLSLTIKGPASNVTGHVDQVIAEMNAAQNIAANSANMLFYYLDQAATFHQYAGYDCTGFSIQAGRVTAVDPTTGTLATPAKAETWHNMSMLNGWTATTARYRLGAENRVYIDVEISSAAATTQQFATLPAGYQPLIPKQIAAGANANVATAVSPFVQVLASGAISMNEIHAFSTAGTWVCSGSYPLD